MRICMCVCAYIWKNIGIMPFFTKYWLNQIYFDTLINVKAALWFKCVVWYMLLFALVVQLLSRVRLFVTPWTAALQASLSITISLSLLKLMPIELVVSSNHLIHCHALLLLPSIFPATGTFLMSQLFTSDGQSIGASASVSSNEYSGLISFGIDWFDLLAVQGTFKSLLQHHSSKA